MNTSDQIASASLFVAAIALTVAVYTVFKGNRSSSVATMVTLNEASREAWHRFLFATTEDDRSYQLAELLNTLEIACSILNEGSFAGVSKGLLNHYLKEAITALKEDSISSKLVEKLFSDEKNI